MPPGNLSNPVVTNLGGKQGQSSRERNKWYSQEYRVEVSGLQKDHYAKNNPTQSRNLDSHKDLRMKRTMEIGTHGI